MFRRNFLKRTTLAGFGATLALNPAFAAPAPKPQNERDFWLSTLTRIADPVLVNLSKGQLKANMPVESAPGQEQGRRQVSYLEAFGRLLAGMAPWLELGPDNTPEGKLRARYLDLTHQALAQAVDPASADFMNFSKGGQPLVDAAFLAHGLLRAPRQLKDKLPAPVRQNLVHALQSSRVISPGYNNWLLFSAMVEAALLELGESWDSMRVDYAVREHLNWYKGDGVYGDGPEFHFDYYNSFVIHPMLLEVVRVVSQKGGGYKQEYPLLVERAKRYADIQERLISPEGTFPVIGRSMAYRFGAFQLLAQMALTRQLPEQQLPAQVRSGLSAVIRRVMAAPGNFDKQGWLTIGFAGHQPGIGETYISTGSLYLCTTGLLPLGLPASDPFWSAPAADWTQKKIWSGQNIPADKALKA
ncbi:DUF2264 domain-containing protein [soil metagenome]